MRDDFRVFFLFCESDKVIRENPANRGTETSAEVLVGPPWRMKSRKWFIKNEPTAPAEQAHTTRRHHCPHAYLRLSLAPLACGEFTWPAGHSFTRDARPVAHLWLPCARQYRCSPPPEAN